MRTESPNPPEPLGISDAVSAFNEGMRAIARDATRVGRREMFVAALRRCADNSPIIRVLLNKAEPAADGAFDVARVTENAQRLRESDPLPAAARALCECLVFTATELQDALGREVNDLVVAKMAELADIASQALPISQRPTAAAPPLPETAAMEPVDDPPPPPPIEREVTPPSSTRMAARPPAPASSGRIAVPRAPSVPQLPRARANPPPPRARIAADASPLNAPKPAGAPPRVPPPLPPPPAAPPPIVVTEPTPPVIAPPPPPVVVATPPLPPIVVAPPPATPVVAAPPIAPRAQRGRVLALAAVAAGVLTVVVAVVVLRGQREHEPAAPSAPPPVVVESAAPPAKALRADQQSEPAPSAPVAAATATPASTSGTLVTSPESAGHRVFVDGKLIGDAPQKLELACGEHAVRVGSKGSLQNVHVPCGAELVVGLR